MKPFQKSLFTFALLACCLSLQARVARIIIDEMQTMPNPSGKEMPYELIAGRAFGELDPKLATNAIIQDIALGLNAQGKLPYITTFLIARPADSAGASGLMWHDVPNRGRNMGFAPQERAAGDIIMFSAWQGDNAGQTLVREKTSVAGMHFLQVPIAKNADGSAVSGEVFARIVNRSGAASQPLVVQTNPVPYKPATLNTAKSKLVSRGFESTLGEVRDEQTIPPTDWAWAKCDAANPFPGTPDSTQICLKNGFDNKRLYQVAFTSNDAYVLGAGFAAWRDVAEFFKYEKQDDAGTPNPIAGLVKHSIGRGISQSGNYLRGSLHLGFNQRESGKLGDKVHDGLWPIIAGRRIALNFRFAQPDGVLELYQAGSEGPQWWLPEPDILRGGASAGILDRCTTTQTCPKIVEHFGSAEVWALKLTPEWVGTDAKRDLPLPDSVRRYYIASSNHGGGAGGFDTSLPHASLPKTGPQCPGNNFGTGILPANPVPHVQTVNAIRAAFRAWVMIGTPPPPSRYPTLLAGQLGLASKAGIGMPDLPGLRKTIPESDFILPVLDYDWGADFNAQDGSGAPRLTAGVAPRIKQAIPMLAPKVDADGNELGGVPVVLLDAPLGTYLGWNVTAGGDKPTDRPFHQVQICNYVGGMIPFALNKAEREAKGDTRLSLEERYGNHEGYIAAVQRAAERAIREGFLLREDAEGLIAQARASRVLKP